MKITTKLLLGCQTAAFLFIGIWAGAVMEQSRICKIIKSEVSDRDLSISACEK